MTNRKKKVLKIKNLKLKMSFQKEKNNSICNLRKNEEKHGVGVKMKMVKCAFHTFFLSLFSGFLCFIKEF